MKLVSTVPWSDLMCDAQGIVSCEVVYEIRINQRHYTILRYVSATGEPVYGVHERTMNPANEPPTGLDAVVRSQLVADLYAALQFTNTFVQDRDGL